jgi:hypothetical protein
MTAQPNDYKIMNQFDEVWLGKYCKGCGRREFCSDPII